MNAFDDETAPGEPDGNVIDAEELERSLAPPGNTAINPDLLDELFETEDPRVQSGIADNESDDDLDFIRMSGLTSPEASAGIDAVNELPSVDEGLTPPVSFYEPGVADVDATMTPVPPPLPQLDAPLDKVQDSVPPALDSEPENSTADELDALLEPADAVDLAPQPPELNLERSVEDVVATDAEPPSLDLAEESAEPIIDGPSPVESGDADDPFTVPEVNSSEVPIEEDQSPALPVLGEFDADAIDVPDLDSFVDDEVFSDLLSPATENAAVVEEASAEDANDSAQDTGPTGEVESNEYPAAGEIPANENDDDQVLVSPEEKIADDASLDDSVFDDVLVDTDDDSATNDPVPDEIAAADPEIEAAVDAEDASVVGGLSPEETVAAVPESNAAEDTQDVSIAEEADPAELAVVEPEIEAAESDEVSIIDEAAPEEMAIVESEMEAVETTDVSPEDEPVPAEVAAVDPETEAIEDAEDVCAADDVSLEESVTAESDDVSVADKLAPEEIAAVEPEIEAMETDDVSTVDEDTFEETATVEPETEAVAKADDVPVIDEPVVEQFASEESETEAVTVADDGFIADESVDEETATVEPEMEAVAEADNVPVIDEPVVEEFASEESETEAVTLADDGFIVDESVDEEIAALEPDTEVVVEEDDVAVIEEPVVEELASAESFAKVAAKSDDVSVAEKLGLEEELAAELVAKAAGRPAREDAAEPLASAQNYGRRSGRHHRRHQPSLPRILKAAAVFLVIGGVMSYGGYEGYRWFQIRIANPTTLYYEAESAAASGKHLQASRLYEEFVRRNSDHPIAADAMFAAGYQMQQVETDDAHLARQYNDESLALLGEFARRYPDHQRAGRAQSLMGIVHYRKGDYRSAVDAFIDRDAILRDPAANLPMLRTLARSYARLGEHEAAHSSYTRAANAPGNPSPDTDYDELGEMYRALAQSAETPVQHRAYQELALENWSHAIRYPGIDPTHKNAIRLKVDLLSELGALNGTPPAFVTQTRNSDLAVPIDTGAEVRQAAFELTTPLPFGPIIKGVPGNDEPESMSEQVIAAPVDDGPIAMEFRVVPAYPSDNEDSVSTPEPVKETKTAEFHAITSGEQLFQIAADHGISAEDLMRWNGIEDANHIEAGQQLIIREPVLDDE